MVRLARVRIVECPARVGHGQAERAGGLERRLAEHRARRRGGAFVPGALARREHGADCLAHRLRDAEQVRRPSAS